MAPTNPPVFLFGYESSTFTLKVRLALRLKQIPYTFITVPSMMPRPALTSLFGLTYRKIPVLAIGRDVYCDTSLILEALESHFPASEGYRSLYPKDKAGRTNRTLIRGFSSYWTDRPLFRVTTGLVPGSVWRTSFGVDRANLIGHKLDPDKLEKKLPQNLSNLDTQLPLFENWISEADGGWLFATETPSAGDIALWYQLKWGMDIASGYGVENLTAGGTKGDDGQGVKKVFNAERYPRTWAWFERFRKYVNALPMMEQKGEEETVRRALDDREEYEQIPIPLLSTPASPHDELNKKTGLVKGAMVSVAPDDTGRDSPTLGELLAITPEEVVLKPQTIKDAQSPLVDARIHFPRIGFVLRPVKASKI